MAISNVRIRLDLAAKTGAWLIALLIGGGALICLYLRIYFEAAAGLVSGLIYCWIQFGLNSRRSRLARRFGFRNPPGMQIAVSLLAFTSVFLGRYFSLYKRTVWFDKSQHLLYGMIFCVIGLVVFYLINIQQRSELTILPIFISLFAVCFSLLCCFVWEIYEFTCDRLFQSNMQAWKQGIAHGLIDTMGDLIAGLAGALLVGIWSCRLLRRDPSGYYHHYISGFFNKSDPCPAVNSGRLS